MVGEVNTGVSDRLKSIYYLPSVTFYNKLTTELASRDTPFLARGLAWLLWDKVWLLWSSHDNLQLAANPVREDNAVTMFQQISSNQSNGDRSFNCRVTYK